MKYQTASYIRSMIYALSCESNHSYIECACVERPDHVDEWQVFLYSRADIEKEYLNLIVLADALLKFLPCCTWYTARYNRSPKGEEYHDAVVLW